MSARAVARVVAMAMAVGAMLGAPADGNEAAHKMAEKFAGSAQGGDKKPTDAAQQDQDDERKAAQAQKRAAAQKTQAARKAAEEKRNAAEAARRAEERRAEEADMLARARREADEMRAADELQRLTQEARRLVEEAEQERARAEALLASQAEEKRAGAADEARLARRRMEETRHLVEKLNRVRQIREARLAAQARRQAEEQARVVRPVEPPPAAPPPAAAEIAPPPPPVDTLPAARPGPRVAAAEMDTKAAAELPAAELPPQHPAKGPVRLSDTQVTVLLILQPGTYGIRRRGPRVADPILCLLDGCYVSTGADQPAVFMPGRKAMRFGNTLGARAGACRGSLGCVFRDVELGSLPGYLQPVDLHILRHDRREVHTVLTDSGCRAEPGRLVCTHGVQAEDYTMWILPESLARAAGPAALERALADGLPRRRSAELTPR